VFATLFNLILRPFNQMIVATKRIKQGDFDINLPVKGFREISHLNQSFNEMSGELDKTEKKLIEFQRVILVR
jgi:nitrate/nitrite-specific signal transduction histidine kinase